MEAIIVSIAAVGSIWLAFFAAVTVFTGISADSAEEFTLAQQPRTKPTTAIALLAVAPVWPVLLPDVWACAALSALFALLACWLLYRCRKLRR
jgi:hypothetical protein